MTTIPGGRFFGPPPYPPLAWPLGEFSTINTDIPVMSVFLVLFSGAAFLHALVFLRNLLQGRRAVISFLITGFALERIAVLSLRIASTLDGYNGDLYVAQFVMLYAGTPILHVINLIFAHQIIRAQHSKLRICSMIVFALIYGLVIVIWGILVAGLIQPFYQRNGFLVGVGRDLRIAGFTMLALITLLPILLVFMSTCTSFVRRSHKGLDGTGKSGGSYFSVILLLLITFNTALEAFFIAGVEWMDPIPRWIDSPPWMARVWYYIMIWTLEFIILILYLFVQLGSSSRKGRSSSRPSQPSNYFGPAGYAGGGPGVSDQSGSAQRKSKSSKLKKAAIGTGVGTLASAVLHKLRHQGDREDLSVEKEQYKHNPNPGPPRERAVDSTPALAIYPTSILKEARGFNSKATLEESETEDSLYAGSSPAKSKTKRNHDTRRQVNGR